MCVPSTVLGARIQQCTNQTEVPLPVDIFLVEKSKAEENVYSIATWMTNSVSGCPASMWD